MAIKIGHASGDERKKITGGQAGDQTTREVVIINWYKSEWNVVLRPKNADLAEKSAKFVEQVCNNSMVGYDQSNRNSLYKEAKAVNFDGSKISVPCECDCSAFMHTAAIAGGANIPYGTNGASTRTLRNVLGNSGYYEVLTDSKYLTSDTYLKRGDIILKEGKHTMMALGNGSGTNARPSTSTSTSARLYLMKGDKGNEVKALQENLIYMGYDLGKYGADGSFGADTDSALRKFQSDYKLTVDGKYGAASKAKLEAAVSAKKAAASKPAPAPVTTTYTKKQFIKDVQACTGAKVDGVAGSETLSKTVTVSRSKNLKHAVVKPIQKYLNSIGFNCGEPDGVAGAKFDAAIKAFQKANGCVVDGEVTAKGKTWKKLLGLA